ncbi:MAG: hypothetical protein GXO07_06130 [Crenarchaeota archaeon]|nr:hypothetical protein [Thermoproteota archaeon]
MRKPFLVREGLIPLKVVNTKRYVGILWGDDPYWPLLKVAEVYDKDTKEVVFSSEAEELSGDRSKAVGVLTSEGFQAVGRERRTFKTDKDHYYLASDSAVGFSAGDSSVELFDFLRGFTLVRHDSVKPIRGADDDLELNALFFAEAHALWEMDYSTKELRKLASFGRPVLDFRYSFEHKQFAVLLGPPSSASLAYYDVEGNRLATVAVGDVETVSRFKLISGIALIPWRRGFKAVTPTGVREVDLGVMVTSFSSDIRGRLFVGLEDGRVVEVKGKSLLRSALKRA